MKYKAKRLHSATEESEQSVHTRIMIKNIKTTVHVAISPSRFVANESNKENAKEINRKFVEIFFLAIVVVVAAALINNIIRGSLHGAVYLYFIIIRYIDKTKINGFSSSNLLILWNK